MLWPSETYTLQPVKRQEREQLPGLLLVLRTGMDTYPGGLTSIVYAYAPELGAVR